MTVRHRNPWTTQLQGQRCYRIESAFFYAPGRLFCWSLDIATIPGSLLDRHLARAAS